MNLANLARTINCGELFTLLLTISRSHGKTIEFSVNNIPESTVHWMILKTWTLCHSCTHNQTQTQNITYSGIKINDYSEMSIISMYLLEDGTVLLYTKCNKYINIRACEMQYAQISFEKYLK